MSDADRRAAARENAAAPSTIAGLCERLRQRLEPVFSGFWMFETKDPNVKRAPSVIGGLPPKTADGLEFPFVLVHPRSGEDTEEGAQQEARAAVDLVIGTYSDSDDGWMDVAIVIDAIRADLGADPVIAGTLFEHKSLTWEIPPQDQARPQWFGRVSTNWILPRPMRVEARNPTEG